MKFSRILTLATLTLLTACNAQQSARSRGGTMEVDLPPGQRLATVTWKDDQFWYLTRPRTAGEEPTTWTFKEKSVYGIKEGTVILREH